MSRLMLFALSSFFVTSVLHAQVTTATLLGTVKDATGAAVPNAAVTAKNLSTGLTRSVAAGSDGNYVISNLPASHYSVTATLAGFKTTTIADIELQVAQQATVNPVLEVGQTTQELTVTAAAPILNYVSSAVGQVVDT